MIYIVSLSSCIDTEINLNTSTLDINSKFPIIYSHKEWDIGGKGINVCKVLSFYNKEYKCLVFDSYSDIFKNHLVEKYSNEYLNRFIFVKDESIQTIRENYKIKNNENKLLFEINQRPFKLDYSLVLNSISNKDLIKLNKDDYLVLVGSCNPDDMIYKICKEYSEKCKVVVDTSYCLKEILFETKPFIVKVNVDEFLQVFDLKSDLYNEDELLDILNKLVKTNKLYIPYIFLTNASKACYLFNQTSNLFVKLDVEHIDKIYREYGNGDAILAMILTNICNLKLNDNDINIVFKKALKDFKDWNNRKLNGE